MGKKTFNKILYGLNLIALLGLNGCSSNIKNIEEETEIISEVNSTDRICDHVNEEKLNIRTSLDGSSNIMSMDILSSIRYNFLNKYSLLSNYEYDSQKYDEKFDSVSDLSLFDSPEFRKGFAIQCNYYDRLLGEDNYDVNSFVFGNPLDGYNFNFDNDLLQGYISNNEDYNYTLIVNSDIFLNDFIGESIQYNNEKFEKYIEVLSGDNEYKVEEKYLYSTFDENKPNKIVIELKNQYYLNEEALLSNDLSCSNYTSTLLIKTPIDQLSIDLTEEQADEIISKMTKSVQNGESLEEFLNKNSQLMTSLSDDYQLFIQKVNSSDKTLIKISY